MTAKKRNEKLETKQLDEVIANAMEVQGNGLTRLDNMTDEFGNKWSFQHFYNQYTTEMSLIKKKPVEKSWFYRRLQWASTAQWKTTDAYNAECDWLAAQRA